jgi:tRNA modification GTPase
MSAAPPPDTIFAPATAAGRAGIAVIRVSGAGAAAALAALAGGAGPPRRMTRAVFRDPESGEALESGLSVFFPGPASFTGEDVAELHIHGGRATVEALCAALRRLGLRFAEPGEFARRAFGNGRLDLAEIEGLADLVAAETEAQRRQALRQLSGALSALAEGWRACLVRALAHLEAAIDFADEDIGDPAAGVAASLAALAGEIAAHLADGRRGERLRDGVEIAILGPPNAGKSSLLNALARREAAIVAETAGTTRDVVEVRLDLGGLPVTVADTAGLREAADAVEAEGVRRALARADAADLRIVLVDASAPAVPAAAAALIDGTALVVANKTDLATAPPPPTLSGAPVHALSLKTGAGLAALLAAIEERARALADDGAGGAPLTRARHRAALEDCHAALVRAQGEAEIELRAEDVRLAARALGRIAGRIDVEDVLDVVFAELCIGK